MTATTLTHGYDRLTRDERFRLLLAAWGRGDESEEGRLTRSAPTVPVRMMDFAPCMMAFKTLALVVYIELLDHAADCETAWLAAETDWDDEAQSARWARIAKAHGYRLRIKWRAWVEFCGDWLATPRLLWEHLPGLDRVERVVAATKAGPCAEAEFLATVNAIRPGDWPPITSNPLTVASALADLRQLFDQQVKHLTP
jgi:hypothetical protein